MPHTLYTSFRSGPVSDSGDYESPDYESDYHHEDGNHVFYHAVTSIPS